MVAPMPTISVECPCGSAHPITYNPATTPFFGARRGSVTWLTVSLPCGRSFEFARRFKKPSREGLFGVFR